MSKIRVTETKLPELVSDKSRNLPLLRFYSDKLGALTAQSLRYKEFPNHVTTVLKDCFDKQVGKEELAIEEGLSASAGLYIEADPKYQNKGYGIGEMLRLASIVTILENKIKDFFIYSKKTAVYFHSKYKYKPAIEDFSQRDCALENVIKNCKNCYGEIRQEAEILLKKSREDRTPEVQRKLCKEANSLLEKYLKLISQKKDEYKSHPFDIGMRMVLKEGEIKKNKDFFNDLFKKYNVDYQI